jgi:hypothetical protein
MPRRDLDLVFSFKGVTADAVYYTCGGSIFAFQRLSLLRFVASVPGGAPAQRAGNAHFDCDHPGPACRDPAAMRTISAVQRDPISLPYATPSPAQALRCRSGLTAKHRARCLGRIGYLRHTFRLLRENRSYRRDPWREERHLVGICKYCIVVGGSECACKPGGVRLAQQARE